MTGHDAGPGWTSVRERLPEDGVPVLAIAGNELSVVKLERKGNALRWWAADGPAVIGEDGAVTSLSFIMLDRRQASAISFWTPLPRLLEGQPGRHTGMTKKTD